MLIVTAIFYKETRVVHTLQHHSLQHSRGTLGVILYFADLQTKYEELYDLPKVSKQACCIVKFSRSTISTMLVSSVNLSKQAGWRMSKKGPRKT